MIQSSAYMKDLAHERNPTPYGQLPDLKYSGMFA